MDQLDQYKQLEQSFKNFFDISDDNSNTNLLYTKKDDKSQINIINENNNGEIIDRGDIQDSKYIRWTIAEDQKLREIVKQQGTKNWVKVSEYFLNKSAKQCIYRWYKFLKASIRDEDWKENEDEYIINYINTSGTKNWATCAKLMNSGRLAKSCKERWYNVLSMNNASNSFSPKDDLTILLLVNKFGTCWSRAIKSFINKSENQVKNRCYSILRKFAVDQITKKEIECVGRNICLKVKDLIKFLPIAIDGFKQMLGEDTYNEVQANVSESTGTTGNKLFCDRDISSGTNNKNTKITINLCACCKTKLKDLIKKIITKKFIQKQISNLQNNYNLNRAGTNDLGMNFDLDIINNSNELINSDASTFSKLEALKQIVSNFSQNIQM